MSGIQEILLIVLLFVLVVFLPGRRGRGRGGSGKESGKLMNALSGHARLGVIASAVWLLAWAVYFRPWSDGLLGFALAGLSPVVLGWGVLWVVEGFRKDRDA